MKTDRRRFVQAAPAISLIPRHVLGGQAAQPAPSGRIHIALVGCGTEAVRELPQFIRNPKFRFTAVCDPCRPAAGYRDWSANGLLMGIRKLLEQPDWGAGFDSVIPAGLDVTKSVIESYYKAPGSVRAYTDFRELLDKESDLQAVWIMTPDHHHGWMSLRAMARRLHVMMHKPIANRLTEAKAVIDAAKKTGVATHFLAWNTGNGIAQVKQWIDSGAIGTLREIHNWTNRPVWPQYAELPQDAVPVPRGFEWNLWLGPEKERPYHPCYTHMTFRGWYDFGGGTLADMGIYALWSVFRALKLGAPDLIEPLRSHQCRFDGNSATRIQNDFSFPSASVTRIRFPKTAERPAVDLFWYDGGMKPFPPEETGLEEFPAEAMMFRGDKGVIVSGFRVEKPVLYAAGRKPQEAAQQPQRPDVSELFAEACRGGQPSPGAFTEAWGISETVCLWGAALRAGRRLKYDAAAGRFTNDEKANEYLTRTYRAGWELPQI